MTKIDISQIASLSKLKLDESEKKHLSKDLESILDYVDQLKEFNVKSASSKVVSAGQQSNIFRDDKVENSGITHVEIKKNAPKFENDSFMVPGVFE